MLNLHSFALHLILRLVESLLANLIQMPLGTVGQGLTSDLSVSLEEKTLLHVTLSNSQGLSHRIWPHCCCCYCCSCHYHFSRTYARCPTSTPKTRRVLRLGHIPQEILCINEAFEPNRVDCFHPGAARCPNAHT